MIPIKVPIIDTLAVELPSKPIFDKSIKSAMRLKSHIAYMTKLDETFLDNDSITHAANGVSIYFGEAVLLNPSKNESKGTASMFRIIPCNVDEDILYLYHYRSVEGRDSFDVQSLSQFKKLSQEIILSKNVTTEDVSAIQDMLDLEDVENISILDPTDKSIVLVKDFFDSIEAVELKNKFTQFIDIFPVFSVKGNASSYQTIVVDKNMSSEEMMPSILEQFLDLTYDYNIKADKKVLIGALSLFIDKYKSVPLKEIYSAELYREIKELLFTMNNALKGIASNEGSIIFLENAYKTTVDVSDVSMEDCETSGIIEDVRRIFDQVAEHDYTEYLEKNGEASAFPLDRMPGYRKNLVIRKISNSLLPTAISLPEGKILLSENFIKILYKLKQLKLNDSTFGAMVRGMNEELGNFYDSIIFSIALHEIRGHYNIANNGIQYEPDEMIAQSQRGRKHLEGNLLAMMLFWFWLVEGAEWLPNTGSVQNFIRENQVLFKYLLEDDQHDFFRREVDLYHFDTSMGDFIVDIRSVLKFDIGSDIPSIKRIPIPDDPLPEIPELAMAQEKDPKQPKLLDVFSLILSRKSLFNVEEVAKAFNVDKDNGIQQLVDAFLDWNVIQKSGKENGMIIYKSVDLPGNEVANIISLLSMVPEPFDEKALDTVGALIKEITSKYQKVLPEVLAQRSKQAMAATWQNVVRVFDFLTLQRGEPITVTELVDLIFVKNRGSKILKYYKLVSSSAECLMKLGLVRYNLKTSAYTLIEPLSTGDKTLVKSIKYFLLSLDEKLLDGSINYSALAEDIEQMIAGKLKSIPEVKREPDVFWKSASMVFGLLVKEKKPISLSQCLTLAGGDMQEPDLLRILEVLVDTGAILKYVSKSTESYYGVRRFANNQKYNGIFQILKEITTGLLKTDIKKLKTLIYKRYSMSRTWLNVLEVVPLLISMNEVYMVLVKEGLDDSREYTASEINQFYNELEEKYFGINSGVSREQLISLMAEMHGLDAGTAALLDHRLMAFETYGRKAEPWTFSVRTISVYLRQINETLKDRSTEAEKELYALTSKIRAVSLDIDLFILKDLGILSEADRGYSYSLAKFFNPKKIKERILRLGSKRLNVPVQPMHFQKIRDVLFANVPPTWPIASFVFTSLQMDENKTIPGGDLLANLNSGVDKGSWNMFNAVLEYLNLLGIVYDFSVPEMQRPPINGEEFNRTEFSAISLSEKEMLRFGSFVDSIGRICQEDFTNILPKKEDRLELMQDLYSRGYINKFKKISSSFWEIGNYENLKFTDYFEKKKQLTLLQRKGIYRVLEKAHLEYTFSKDNRNIERVKQKFVLEVLDPTPQGAFYIFKVIRSLLEEDIKRRSAVGIKDTGYPIFTEILGRLQGISPDKLIVYLKYLDKIGLIETLEDTAYRPVRMYGAQMDSVKDILGIMDKKIDLKDDESLTLITTSILSVTEPLWAKRFLDDLERVVSKIAKDEAGGPVSKVLLAFDTSWIPVAQKNHVMDVLRAVSKLNNITLVISDTPGGLAAKIEKDRETISWKDVITFVNYDALVNSTGDPGVFWKTYNSSDTDKMSHVIGIDNSNLSSDTYVRLLEMISMAYEHSFNIWESPLRHPHIEVLITKTKEHPILSRKYIIFTP